VNHRHTDQYFIQLLRIAHSCCRPSRSAARSSTTAVSLSDTVLTVETSKHSLPSSSNLVGCALELRPLFALGIIIRPRWLRIGASAVGRRQPLHCPAGRRGSCNEAFAVGTVTGVPVQDSNSTVTGVPVQDS
jgi:hypothetical protein